MRATLSGCAVIVAVTLAASLPAHADASPSGTVSFSIEAEPAPNTPTSITVSGESSQAGELVVYSLSGDDPVGSGGGQCPVAEHRSEVVLGDIGSPVPVGPGSYTQTYSFTPEAPGAYILCGYLYDPSSSDTIYAAGTGSFNAAYHLVEVVATGPTGKAPASTESEPPPKPSPPPPHMTELAVAVHSHAGRTAAKPGRTELRIQAKGGALVLVVLTRQGRRRETEFSYASWDRLNVRWTCSRPGGVYGFTITATDAYGKRLTRHGRFRPVSAKRCRALRIADARRHREEETAAHREAEREEREEQSPQHKIEVGEREFCEQVLDGSAEETSVAAGHIYTHCATPHGEVVIGEGVI